jgi:hypothetical protein
VKFNFLGKMLAAAACAAFAGSVTAAPLTTGNVLVVRIGSGAAPMTGAAEIFLDEYTPSGTLVQSFPVPSTGVDACTIGSGTTTEGNICASPDGNFYTVGGYAHPAGSTGQTAVTVNRTVARLTKAGVVDTTTHMDTTLTSTGSLRDTVTDNGNRFWISTEDRGVVFLGTFGATQSGVQLNSVRTNLRGIGIYNGQLYADSGSIPVRGPSTVGTGLPTTFDQPVTLLPGFPTDNTRTPFNFQFESPTRVWESNSVTGFRGVQDWNLSGGTWSLGAGTPVTIAAPTNVNVTVGMDGANPAIFASTGTTIEKMARPAPGVAGTFSVIATAATNTIFRGLVAIGPESTRVNDWSLYND